MASAAIAAGETENNPVPLVPAGETVVHHLLEGIWSSQGRLPTGAIPGGLIKTTSFVTTVGTSETPLAEVLCLIPVPGSAVRFGDFVIVRGDDGVYTVYKATRIFEKTLFSAHVNLTEVEHLVQVGHDQFDFIPTKETMFLEAGNAYPVAKNKFATTVSYKGAPNVLVNGVMTGTHQYFDFVCYNVTRGQALKVCNYSTRVVYPATHSGDRYSGSYFAHTIKIGAIPKRTFLVLGVVGYTRTKIREYVNQTPVVSIVVDGKNGMIHVPLDRATVGDGTAAVVAVLYNDGTSNMVYVLNTPQVGLDIDTGYTNAAVSAMAGAAIAECNTYLSSMSCGASAAGATSLTRSTGAGAGAGSAVVSTGSTKTLPKGVPLVFSAFEGTPGNMPWPQLTRTDGDLNYPKIPAIVGKISCADNRLLCAHDVGQVSWKSYFDAVNAAPAIVIHVDPFNWERTIAGACETVVNGFFVMHASAIHTDKSKREKAMRKMNSDCLQMSGPTSIVVVEFGDGKRYMYYAGLDIPELCEDAKFGDDVTATLTNEVMHAYKWPCSPLQLREEKKVFMEGKMQDKDAVLAMFQGLSKEEFFEDPAVIHKFKLFAAQLSVVANPIEIDGLRKVMLEALLTVYKVDTSTAIAAHAATGAGGGAGAGAGAGGATHAVLDLERLWERIRATEDPTERAELMKVGMAHARKQKALRKKYSEMVRIVETMGSRRAVSSIDGGIKRAERRAKIRGNVDAVNAMSEQELAEAIESDWAVFTGVVPPEGGATVGSLLDARMPLLDDITMQCILTQVKATSFPVPLVGRFCECTDPSNICWPEESVKSGAPVNLFRIMLLKMVAKKIFNGRHKPHEMPVRRFAVHMLMTYAESIVSSRASGDIGGFNDTTTQMVRCLLGHIFTFFGSGSNKPMSSLYLLTKAAPVGLTIDATDIPLLKRIVGVFRYSGWDSANLHKNIGKLASGIVWKKIVFPLVQPLAQEKPKTERVGTFGKNWHNISFEEGIFLQLFTAFVRKELHEYWLKGDKATEDDRVKMIKVVTGLLKIYPSHTVRSTTLSFRTFLEVLAGGTDTTATWRYFLLDVLMRLTFMCARYAVGIQTDVSTNSTQTHKMFSNRGIRWEINKYYHGTDGVYKNRMTLLVAKEDSRSVIAGAFKQLLSRYEAKDGALPVFNKNMPWGCNMSCAKFERVKKEDGTKTTRPTDPLKTDAENYRKMLKRLRKIVKDKTKSKSACAGAGAAAGAGAGAAGAGAAAPAVPEHILVMRKNGDGSRAHIFAGKLHADCGYTLAKKAHFDVSLLEGLGVSASTVTDMIKAQMINFRSRSNAIGASRKMFDIPE